MITALKIIERMFSKAGIRAAETPLEASEVETGKDILNDLITMWNATGTLRGVDVVADINDAVNIERFMLPALAAKGALTLAGEFDVEITAAMVKDADDSLNNLIKATRNLENINFPPTLPLGSGNYTDFDDSDFFPELGTKNF